MLSNSIIVILSLVFVMGLPLFTEAIGSLVQMLDNNKKESFD